MSMLSHTGKYLWGGLLHFAHRMFTPLMIVVILYAAIVAGFTALTPWVRMYKPEINDYLNHSLQHKIEIEDVKTSWYGLYPVVKFIHVKIVEPKSEPWVCDECWVGFDILRSILYWHVHPGLLYVDGVQLNIQQQQGHWGLKQAKFLNSSSVELSQDVSTNLFKMVLGVLSYIPEKILLKNIDIQVQPEHAAVVTFQDVRVLGQKKEGKYFWAAEANLDKKSLLKLNINMPMLSDLNIPNKGQVYFEAVNLNLNNLPWHKELCQYFNISGLKGETSFQAWVDWENQMLSVVHATLNGKDFALQSAEISQGLSIPSYTANMLWQKNSNGWELAIDKLNVNLAEESLQDNKLLLFYRGDWDNYHFYIQDFPLTLLKRMKSLLPAELLKPVVMQSHGQLKELQLNFKNGQVDYFLSQFEQVSWPTLSGIPAVNHLSGVVNWEDENLNLEFSSPGLELQFAGGKPIRFDNFEAVMSSQKQLNQSTLHIENILLTRQDMALNVSGDIDSPLNAELRNLRLLGTWSLENVHNWKPYLSQWLPASGLRRWLQNDVKRLDKSSGEFLVNGMGKDFPFAEGNGEFIINSYLYGVDLVFAPGWPMVKNIDGQLMVHQRNLEVKIDKADLAPDVPVKQLSLLAPDLGLNHETLLIHGELEAPVKTMVNYLLHTPLANRAQKWKPFQFQGKALLDLKLDIPLTDAREVYTQGRIKFPEQNANIDVFAHPLVLSNAQGYLDFNDDGLLGGILTGRIGGDRFKINVSHPKDLHRTIFDFTGGVDLSVLKHAWGIENTDFMKGHMPLQGQIMLPHEQFKNIDMQWKSSLKGVSLDLPEPWHKSADEEKPLVLNASVASSGVLNMNLDYQQMRWKFALNNKVWQIETTQPNFAGQITYNPNGQIDAKLSKLWLDSHLFNSQGNSASPWNVKDLPNIRLEVADFRWEKLALGQMTLIASQKPNAWTIEQISVQTPHYAMLIQGEAKQSKKAGFSTQFHGEMKIGSLEKMLEMWEITPVANCRDGYIRFQGGWKAALNKISLKTLDGDLDIALKKGNITHLDAETEQKIGLGKLLSILSLQTLPRRLQLDFSDLATQGFTYDLFKGHFDLHNGLLTTTDSMMDGPIAHVKMRGDLNVLDRWYDLELQVYPYITASLPVVATIAGGPLAGVATWAANHVINQGMQKVSGYTYKITGPWQQPVVQQVGLERKH
jgi:uncharacterized protein YhdP